MARLLLLKRAPPLLHSSLAGAMLALQKSKPALSVLQIGAFDGETYDPINSFLTEFQPFAVLLEPVPASFANLERVYAGYRSIMTVNAALADTTGTASMFCVDASFESSISLPALSSFRREVIESHEHDVPGISNAIREITVPTICASDLWNLFGEGKPDVLVIDTEGFDYQVMRLLGVPAIMPSIIYFEHRHLTHIEFREAMNVLTNADYRLILDSQDALAVSGGGSFP